MPSSPPSTPSLPTGSRARVVAVVRPFRLDHVMEELSTQGCHDVIVEQVRGYGRQKAHLSFYEGQGFGSSFLPKVRLEFDVAGERLEQVVEALCRGARTGRIGDGKIFAHTIEAAPAAKGA